MTIKSTGYAYKITRCPITGQLKTKRILSTRYKAGQTFDSLLDLKLKPSKQHNT